MTSTDARPTEVEYDPDAYKRISDVYRHEDGSLTYIVRDDDGSAANPRDDHGNVATLVQRNEGCIDLDEPDDQLKEARDRWARRRDTRHLVDRYIAMFRPDILYYDEHWSAGDSYGWGYVSRADWDRWQEPSHLSRDQAEAVLAGVDPIDRDPEKVRKAFDSELSVFRQWVEGEVYGAHHVEVGDPIVEFWDHGAYIAGYETDEDSCWGFLGYDDHKDIAWHFTDSPITEVLA